MRSRNLGQRGDRIDHAVRVRGRGAYDQDRVGGDGRGDRDGVGKLVKLAVEKGRQTRSDLKVGICGEHGGDPSSVEFCHMVGLNYVCCSPFRVPIARLAAAQAAIKNR